MKKIVLFLFSLNGGGSERVIINLANGLLSYGYHVEIVVVKNNGEYREQINKDIKIVQLECKRAIFSLFGLIKYLNNNEVYAIISPWCHLNIISVVAKMISKSKCKVILTEHTVSSIDINNSKGFLAKVTPYLMRKMYPKANSIVAVSNGVRKDLAKLVGIEENKIDVIYNPLISDEVIEKSHEYIDDEWFKNLSGKKIISVGRLSYSKDFPTLLKAFSLVRKEIDCSLIILGEGEDRQELYNLARELEIDKYIAMPGFVNNPLKYIKQSDVFAFPSMWEGLGNVIVEALACKTPIICADCPIGPKEILDNGRYGILTEVRNYKQMAKEIINIIATENDFNIDYVSAIDRFRFNKNIEKYIEVIER